MKRGEVKEIERETLTLDRSSMDSKENDTTSEVEMETKEAAAEETSGEADGNEETNEEEESEIKEEEEVKDDENDKNDANPSSASKPSIEGSSPGKIFVGGLPKDTTDDKFKNHFQKYGNIVDSVIMKHRGTGLPRGFGFITFEDPAVVDVVILDKHVFGEKEVEIKRTIPKGAITGKDFKTKKIFVGGIPASVTDDEFKNFFAKFGEVEEHQIMRDHSSGRSRGFGFIAFSTENAVDDLLTKGNRIEFAGAQVEIKKAEPKKPGNASAPTPPTKHYNNPRSSYGRGFKDHYGGVAGGAVESVPYRYAGGLASRARGYGGYVSEFDGGYGGYGGTGVGSYGGDPSLGFSSRYGGGMGRGYCLSGYVAPTESFDRYGGAAGYGSGAAGAGYGTGYASGPGVGGYGGGGGYGSSAGLYGGRRDYGGGPSGRYHPYSR